MKKLVLIALAFIGLQAFAQDKKEGSHQCPMHNMSMSHSEKDQPENSPHCEKHDMMKNLSAEEIANLETKKMTLMLDLNESQQKSIYNMHLENSKKRKSHMEEMKSKKEKDSTMKCSSTEKAKMMNCMLDHRIEMKSKLKTILTPEQFEKWENTKPDMHEEHHEKKGCCKKS